MKCKECKYKDMFANTDETSIETDDCYLLYIMDTEPSFDFQGVFLDEESLLKAYLDLENNDYRFKDSHPFDSSSFIMIYQVPLNELCYIRELENKEDKYDFIDYLDNSCRIDVAEVADIYFANIAMKVDFDIREANDEELDRILLGLTAFEREFLAEFGYLEARWKPLNKLKAAEKNISGLSYSNTYAKRHKKNKRVTSAGGGKIGIAESVEIRKNTLGEIEYCITNRLKNSFNLTEIFHTHLGDFAIDNQGEFGGKMTLPNGKEIGGNYCYVFECGAYVYAVESLAHMMTKSFSLICFSSAEDYKILYSTMTDIFGVLRQMLNDSEPEKKYDNVYLGAYTIDDSKLYIIITGNLVSLSRAEGRKDYNGCSKLLIIKDGSIEDIIEIDEEFEHIGSLCVADGIAYVGMDKMLAMINLHDRTHKLFNAVSSEDEDDLLGNS